MLLEQRAHCRCKEPIIKSEVCHILCIFYWCLYFKPFKQTLIINGVPVVSIDFPQWSSYFADLWGATFVFPRVCMTIFIAEKETNCCNARFFWPENNCFMTICTLHRSATSRLAEILPDWPLIWGSNSNGLWPWIISVVKIKKTAAEPQREKRSQRRTNGPITGAQKAIVLYGWSRHVFLLLHQRRPSVARSALQETQIKGRRENDCVPRLQHH